MNKLINNALRDPSFWITFLVIFIVIPLLIFPITSYSENDYVLSYSESPDGSSVNYKFDVLYSQTENGAYTWTTAPSGYVAHNPIQTPSSYQYNFGFLGSGYVKGIRIYFTLLGSGDYIDIQMQQINDTTLGKLDHNGDMDMSDYGQDTYARIGYISSSGLFNYVNTSSGVYSYSEEGYTYDYIFHLTSAPFVSYSNTAGSYSFNGFLEFYFVDTDYLGWTAYNEYGSPGSFYFVEGYGSSDESLDFFSYLASKFGGNLLDQLTQVNLPVINTYDFVNGTVISALLASNLSAVLNPFVGVFTSDSTHLTFRYLAMFSFGMFTLMLLLSYLRRVHK